MVLPFHQSLQTIYWLDGFIHQENTWKTINYHGINLHQNWNYNHICGITSSYLRQRQCNKCTKINTMESSFLWNSSYGIFVFENYTYKPYTYNKVQVMSQQNLYQCQTIPGFDGVSAISEQILIKSLKNCTFITSHLAIQRKALSIYDIWTRRQQLFYYDLVELFHLGFVPSSSMKFASIVSMSFMVLSAVTMRIFIYI